MSLPAPHPDCSSLTIAVVGAGGFLGSHLVGFLLARTRWEILAVDLDLRRLSHLPADRRLELVASDYTEPEVLARIADCTVVVSLAAICQPAFYNTQTLAVLESNYENPVKLFKACVRSQTHLVHCSSSEVYGVTVSEAARRTGARVTGGKESLSEDETALVLGPMQESRWSYATAKAMSERWLEAATREQKLRCTVIRPFNFIGPRMDFVPGVDGEGTPRVLACFLTALRDGQPLALVEGGKARRCFTWVGDACEGIFAAIVHPAEAIGQVFNLGHPGNEVDMRGLAGRIGAAWGQELGIPGFTAPTVDVTATAFYGTGYADSDRRLPDVSKAKRLLGWEPRTSLDDALRRTVRWFVEHYGVRK